MGWLQTIFDRQTREPRDPDAKRVSGGVRTLAGVAITPDLALQNPTAWACHRYLTQTVAVCPWHVMRALSTGGKEVAGTHRVDWLLYKRPNPEWGAFQFRETLLSWALLWGNGYAEIERDVLGRPLALWPIHPSRVRVMRDAQTDRLYYEVENGANGKVELAAMDMFHLRGFGDGPVGVSVIEYARESLGWARAAQLFGASFFGNGMNVAGVVQVQKGLQPGGLTKLKAELANLYRGPFRSNKTAILDAGMEFKQVTIDPNKAQFIETQQHLIEETCRLFGVPPHKVGHLLRATFNNIEHLSIEVQQDAILPWVKRFEEEADFKLFGANRQGFFTKINMRGLLRGDFKTQQEGFQIMRNGGALSVDEWRDAIDMNPLPAGAGGDKYVMQGQYVTLDKIGEASASAPVPELDDEADPGDPDEPLPEELMNRAERLETMINA